MASLRNMFCFNENLNGYRVNEIVPFLKKVVEIELPEKLEGVQ